MTNQCVNPSGEYKAFFKDIAYYSVYEKGMQTKYCYPSHKPAGTYLRHSPNFKMCIN